MVGRCLPLRRTRSKFKWKVLARFGGSRQRLPKCEFHASSVASTYKFQLIRVFEFEALGVQLQISQGYV